MPVQPFDLAPQSVEKFREMGINFATPPERVPVVMPLGLSGSQAVWVLPEHVEEVQKAFDSFKDVIKFCG